MLKTLGERNMVSCLPVLSGYDYTTQKEKNAVLSFLSYLVNPKRGYEEATGNDNDIHMSYYKQSNECKTRFEKIVPVGKQI